MAVKIPRRRTHRRRRARIGFGITINRFSMYLMEKDHAPQGGRLFLRDAGNAGLGMVVLGLALLVWSLYRYWRVNADIEQGITIGRHRGTIVVSIGLLLMGGLTALWLFLES